MKDFLEFMLDEDKVTNSIVVGKLFAVVPCVAVVTFPTMEMNEECLYFVLILFLLDYYVQTNSEPDKEIEGGEEVHSSPSPRYFFSVVLLLVSTRDLLFFEGRY